MLVCRLFSLYIIFIICFAGQSLWADTTIPLSVDQKSFKQLSRVSKLPQIIEQNLGQFNRDYDYLAHTPETFFAFAKDHVSLVLNTPNEKNTNAIKMRFVGANEKPVITGLNNTKQKIHYYRGKPSQWLQNISTYSKVEYKDIYSGIDLQFYFNRSQMEFDFIVKPGKNPDDIAFVIEDADKLAINKVGELVISLNDQTLIQKKPVIYQIVQAQKKSVDGQFKLEGNVVSFNVENYDAQYPLVIDPVIEFSSYFGGDWEDQANVIRADSAGNIFVGGATSARARITVDNILNAEETALLVQANANDEIFQADHGISLDADVLADATLDLSNDKIITVVNGVTQTEDFDYACDYEYSGFFSNDRLVVDYDGFISKFDKDFSPIFTTYFGGCRNDSIRSMVIGSNDNIYVTGITLSIDFPVKFPARSTLAESRFANDPIQADAFYAKFDNDGALIFASYLGGDGQDGGRDIAVDADENIYLLGYTHSMNLPTTPCPDVGVSVISCDYLGGINEAAADQGSTDISIFSDAFVAKISSSGDVISFLTYFGGKYDDWGQTIALHDDGIYIAGNTASPDIPVGDSGDYSFMPYNLNQTKDEVIGNRKELFCTRVREEKLTSLSFPDAHICQDVFLAKLNIDGTNVIFSTYFGGDDDDNISQIKIDSLGYIYLNGTTKSKGARLSSGIYNLSNESVLEPLFPLYKNMNQFKFDLDTVYTSSFFSVFTPDASTLAVSSFIGGDNNDTGNALVIKENPPNADGATLVDVYIAGHTLSENFHTLHGFQSHPAKSDIYLLKLSFDRSKINDPYVPLDPKKLDPKNSDNVDYFDKYLNFKYCNEITIISCIKYSTLLGGEKLDSLKSITLLPNDAGIGIAGVTFSSYFPVSDDALKKSITGLSLVEYEPVTRNIIDQYTFYPSDMLLLRVSDGIGDGSDEADLQLTVDVENTGSVAEDDRISYSINIQNQSTSTLAKSVRLTIQYPYVARLEDLNKYLSINAEGCDIDIQQMYCLLGDLSPTENSPITFSVLTRNSGNFSIKVAISSMTGDPVKKNNFARNTVNVKAKPNGAALGAIFIALAALFLSWRLYPYFSTRQRRSGV